MEDSEKKLRVVRELLEGSLPENEDLVRKNLNILAQDVILHGPDWDRKEVGSKRLVDLDIALSKAFEKKALHIRDLYVHNDKVIAEWEFNVVHKGELAVLVDPPIPPTGEEITILGISIYRFHEDKVCEIWQGWDFKGLVLHLRQASEVDSFDFLSAEKKEYYLEGAPKLSGQERQCLHYLLLGNTAQETATEMELSPRTVESYLESSKNKLSCDHKRELFKAALFLERINLLAKK